MTSHFAPLPLATWSEDDQGNAYSHEYSDVYHSRGGALPQARHVFLRGNSLPARWQGRSAFTVCELGFGLGHNFLACWQAWRDDPQRSARLHYLAFEAHPFALQDLRRAWAGLPLALHALAQELADAWPALLPGVHRIELSAGKLTLTLVLGNIERTARQAQACVDAFFLDGFAPRLNPAMWSPALFGQLRRLAAQGATVATWCAAGQVRRDLQNAGFLVSKAPGFGGKRDMTVASLRPGLGAQAMGVRQQQVAVVGGGLAGASMAQALARRGHRVEVWDPDCALDQDPVWRARGAAALVPALSPDDDTRSRLSRAGLARARALWLDLAGDARPDPCGALVCAQSQAQSAWQQQALERLQFPSDWVCWLDQAQARCQSGVAVPYGALWFPEALRVCPGELIAALLSLPGVVRRPARVGGLQPQPGGGWLLLDDAGQVQGHADQLVLANAGQARSLLAGLMSLSDWPVLSGMKLIAGQLSMYPVGEDQNVPLCILSAQGYCLPARHGWAVAGSTYRSQAQVSVADELGHQAILARLAKWLPAGAVPWLGRHPAVGWAGWRAASRDHLPIVSAVPQQSGLWLACAYGSRGLSWAALAGEWLGAQLNGEPLPLERELLKRIQMR